MTFINEDGTREEYRPLNPWRDEDLDKLVNRILFGRAGVWVTFDQLLKLIDWGDNLSRQQQQDTRIRLRGAIRRLLVSGAIQRRREGQAAYRKIDQETLDLFETALKSRGLEANASTSAVRSASLAHEVSASTSAVGGTFCPADGASIAGREARG